MTADRRSVDLSAPSDRATLWLHAIAMLILLVQTVYWLAQPCVGDFMCAPMGGLFTAAGLIPLAVGFAVWRAAGRPSVLLLVDVFILSTVGLLLVSLLLEALNPVALSLGLVPVLLFAGAIGLLADLAGRRIERGLAIAALLLLAAWLFAGGFPPSAVLPLLAAGLAAVGAFRRTASGPVAAGGS